MYPSQSHMQVWTILSVAMLKWKKKSQYTVSKQKAEVRVGWLLLLLLGVALFLFNTILKTAKRHLLPVAKNSDSGSLCGQSHGVTQYPGLFEGRQWLDTNYELTNGEWPVATYSHIWPIRGPDSVLWPIRGPDGASGATRPWHWGLDNDRSLTILALNWPNPHTASCFVKMTHQKAQMTLENGRQHY